MGNRIESVGHDAMAREELAAFLASFVRSGALPHPKPGDDRESVWLQRFSWWWDDNPFSNLDSPRGDVLRDGEGIIVGFNGFIPFDYEIDGHLVPTLVTTTLFVLPEHRHSVIALLMRQRALAREFQIVEGSPSPEVREMLGRMGYHAACHRSQYFFPLVGLGGEVSQSLLQRIGLSVELPSARKLDREYLVNDPNEIELVPELHDGKLRRRITRESLTWLSSVGSESRTFFGLCDGKGTLLAYAIGLYKARFGLQACLLNDHVDFLPRGGGIERLIFHLTTAPFDSGLLSGTDLVAWSVLHEEERKSTVGVSRESILHFHLPGDLEAKQKACVPFEGDLPLL